MNWGKHVVEAATLIVAAVVCALVANAFASRERKLVLVSEYSKPVRPVVAAAAPPPPSTMSSVAAGPPAGPVPGKKPAPTRKPATRQPVNPSAQQASIDRFLPHPDKAYVEIHYSDVAFLHANGALFLDARRSSVYEEGHIAGARSFPVWESDIDERVNKLFAERSEPADQNKPIVIYCSGGECEDSHMLAQKLWGIQFNNVYVYKDGFPDWESHGGAVDRGSNP